MRVELKLKRMDRVMSAWEISKFLNKFNNKYYKIDLLNKIATSSTEEDSELFIMLNSFSLENKYSYMKEEKFFLDKVSNLKKLYYLGIPISINKNNVFFKELGYYFYVIRSLNTKFHKYKVPKIKLEVLSKIYYFIQKYERNLIEIKKLNKILVEIINKVCEENLKNFKIESSKDEKDLIKLKREVTKILKNLNYNKIRKDFFDIFNKVERPVIGIYHKKDSSFEILCSYSISPLITSSEKLDIKKIEHNSPTTIIAFMGGFSILFLIPLLKSIFISYNKKNIPLEEYQNNRKKLEEKLNELEKISTKEDLEIIEKIKNIELKTSLKNLQNYNIIEIEKLLKLNKMFENLEINIKE